MNEKAQVLRTLLVTALVAAILLVVAILPAEYGIDPLGTGEALGLDAMAEAPGGGNFAATDLEPLEISRDFELEPFEAIEFKLLMHAGDGMIYHWQASGPLDYELHAHGPHMAEGDAVFMSTGEGASEGGTYIATFAGEHGWHFANRSIEPVRLTLRTVGHVDGTVLYRNDRRIVETLGGE